jgi:hypothetical protein
LRMRFTDRHGSGRSINFSDISAQPVFFSHTPWDIARRGFYDDRTWAKSALFAWCEKSALFTLYEKGSGS